MATGHKTYYLVKGSQFWEIRVKGRDTVIRGGKVGCKGRQFPAKEHPTPAKALQFALRQVNAKIILGFESIEEDCNKSLVIKTPSNQNVKKPQGTGGSGGKTVPSLRPKQPPKKRDTIRRLVQQKTLRCQLQDHLQTANGNSPVVNKTAVAPWRKPPKKQSTIRRMMRRESTIRQPKINDQTTPVKRKKSSTKTKALPKRQLLTQSEKTPASTSRILTRQASRQNPQADAEVKPRTLGTLTFIERSSTLPVDVEIWQSSENTNSLLKPEQTVVHKSEKVKSPNGDQTELITESGSMPILTREETITVNLNKPALTSAPSLTVGVGDVYIPAASSWPMQLQASVLWSEDTASDVCANAVYVDNNMCIYGDDSGKVVQLNSSAKIEKTYQLHTKVRTIQKQDGYLYIGCCDGIVYEISNGIPYQMYQPPTSSFREVQGMVLYGNVLVTSNVKGQLCAVDHDGRVLWQKKSMGDGGWMLCADDSGAYHGHSGGVTKYVLQDGNQIWYRRWTASIFGVVQSETHLYVADNVRIKKLQKDTGVHEKTYVHKGSGCIMSVAMGGGLLFAAGSACITCYEETSAQVVYRLLQGGQPLGLQYHLGRLYCVGAGGLTVIDLSEEGIKKHKGDKYPQHTLPSTSRSSSSIRSLVKVPSLSSSTKQGVTLHCVKDTIPKVKPESDSFNCDLSVEFPLNIRRVGARYVVNDLKASNTGQFYRIEGDIFELE